MVHRSYISFLFMLVYCMSCVWQLPNKRIYDDDDDVLVCLIVKWVGWVSPCVGMTGWVGQSLPLYLSELISHYTFHPDRCVLPIQISLPDQPVLLATFPPGPFLCLHLLLGTLYLHTFVLSIPYPPLNATKNSISTSLPYHLVILYQSLGFVLTIFGAI